MAVPNAGEYRLAGRNAGLLNGNTLQDLGTDVVGQVYFPGGLSLFSGNGAPGSKVNGKTPVIGDLFFRLDGAVGSLIYRCAVAGPPSTWVVVL
jgi:hypothetical protein